MAKKNNKRKRKVELSPTNRIISISQIPVSQAQSSPTDKKWSNYIKLILSSLITLVGIVSGGMAIEDYFSNKVDVSASQTMDENDAFATLLEVHNAGKCDMSGVSLTLEADSIFTWNTATKREDIYFTDIEVIAAPFQTAVIESNQYWTTRIPFKPVITINSPNIRFKSAYIRVALKYCHLWRDVEKRFYFIGQTNPYGKMIWTRQPG